MKNSPQSSPSVGPSADTGAVSSFIKKLTVAFGIGIAPFIAGCSQDGEPQALNQVSNQKISDSLKTQYDTFWDKASALNVEKILLVGQMDYFNPDPSERIKTSELSKKIDEYNEKVRVYRNLDEYQEFSGKQPPKGSKPLPEINEIPK